MQVCLLRVGIDTGSGGMLSPLFDDDNFEFVPIPDPGTRGRTYGELPGPKTGRPLLEFFPSRRQPTMSGIVAHYDPEFESFTYGDPTRPKRSLRRLRPGDLLVFYSGLEPYGFEDESRRGLYLIAYLEVEAAGHCNGSKAEELRRLCARNFHVKYRHDDSNLILVKGKGSPRSRVLERAHLISQNGHDKSGRRIYVLSEEAKKHVGTFPGKLNAIQRSVPRWVSQAMTEKAATWIRGLKFSHENPACAIP